MCEREVTSNLECQKLRLLASLESNRQRCFTTSARYKRKRFFYLLFTNYLVPWECIYDRFSAKVEGLSILSYQVYSKCWAT